MPMLGNGNKTLANATIQLQTIKENSALDANSKICSLRFLTSDVNDKYIKLQVRRFIRNNWIKSL